MKIMANAKMNDLEMCCCKTVCMNTVLFLYHYGA